MVFPSLCYSALLLLVLGNGSFIMLLCITCIRCRKGSAQVLVNFDDLCPSDTLSADKQADVTDNGKGSLGNFQICGKEVPRGYWVCTSG